MKNILILDTGREWGGGTNSLLELLRRINRRDYKFTVLFYHNYPKLGESDIKTEIERLGIDFILFASTKQPFFVKVLKETGRALLFFSRKVRRLYLFYIDYLFRIKKDAEKITKLLKELNIDLLYMNNQPSTNLDGIIAAKGAGVKSLLHSRIEAELNFFEADAVNKWLTKMICVSEGIKNSFVKQGVNNLKCVVIHNGIDTTITPAVSPDKIRQELGIKEDELLIGAVGSLVKRKRFQDLIKAVSLLRIQDTRYKIQDTDKIKCIIVGDGPERETLLKEVDKNNLKEKVILTGFKSDAMSYINAMDIFVLPSEREGFPRVILEAMLMGKPVVASDIAGPSEMVVSGETGFLVLAEHPQMFTEAILRLLKEHELRKHMGEKGRRRVIEDFPIERYVNGVEKVFAEVLGN